MDVAICGKGVTIAQQARNLLNHPRIIDPIDEFPIFID
jgi:hypothetical protein